MSTENLNGGVNKRKAENNAEDLNEDFLRIKATQNVKPDNIVIDDSDNYESRELNNKAYLDDALITLENLRRDLNVDNCFFESSEASDCESEGNVDESHEQMIHNAHYLGYTACIHETFRFLDGCGIPESDPIYEHLKKQFIESTDRT